LFNFYFTENKLEYALSNFTFESFGDVVYRVVLVFKSDALNEFLPIEMSLCIPRPKKPNQQQFA